MHITFAIAASALRVLARYRKGDMVEAAAAAGAGSGERLLDILVHTAEFF